MRLGEVATGIFGHLVSEGPPARLECSKQGGDSIAPPATLGLRSKFLSGSPSYEDIGSAEFLSFLGEFHLVTYLVRNGQLFRSGFPI